MPTPPSPIRSAARLVLVTWMLCLLAPGLASAQPKVLADAPLLPLARAGAFTPVHVDITTTEPLKGEIHIDFGGSDPALVRPFNVGRQSTRRVSVPVMMPTWFATMNVQVMKGRKLLAASTLQPAFPGNGVDALHIVAIGEDPLGLTLLREVTGQPIVGHSGCSDTRSVRVETLLPRSLPNVWFGWTSVDLVVWRRPEPSELTPEQQGALREWVLSGGTLVVGLADNHASWTASPLGALTGGTVTGTGVSPAALQAVLGLGEGRADTEAGLPIVTLSPGSASPRMVREELPVLDNIVGAGRVVTLGFDPAAGELRGLLDRERFWRNLMGLAEGGERQVAHAGPPIQRDPDPCEGGGELEWGSHNHGQKLVTWRSNLESMLGSFSRANPLPLSVVLIFGLAYLLLIGPVDFLVTRKLRKPMLTWVTFPLTAFGFSVLAAAVITFQKAGDTELRCVEVVDLFTEEQGMRGSAWCSMWSSRRQSVRIPNPRGQGVVLAGGGAAEADAALAGQGSEPLIAPTRVGLGFRASQWAVSTWRSAWVDEIAGGITAAGSDGAAVVSSRTGFDIDEAWVVHGSWMWPIGPLADGGTATLGARTSLSWGAITGMAGSPVVEFDDPEYYQLIDGQTKWTESWAMLSDPHTEHVARLPPPRMSGRPMLVGRVAGGIAAPLPDSDDFLVETFAIVRAPLPASFLELL